MIQKKQGTNVIVPLKIEWNHRALTLSPNTLHYVFVENGYIYESTSISSSKHVHGEVKLSTFLVSSFSLYFVTAYYVYRMINNFK